MLKSREKGFTLIEIMIVLGIMAAVVAVALPSFLNRNREAKGFLREITVLSKELHTRAKLNGCVYRIVIDLSADDPNAKFEQSYWIEKANAGTVIRADEEAQALERARETDPEKKVDPRGFDIDKSIMKEPRKLPRGLTFDKIELARAKEPITKGRAFIHYLPQGLVDETAIHIKSDKGQEWTIAISPLTARAEVISKPVTLEELKSE